MRETTSPEVNINSEARESVGDLFIRLERAGWRVEMDKDDDISSSMPPQYQSVEWIENSELESNSSVRELVEDQGFTWPSIRRGLQH